MKLKKFLTALAKCILVLAFWLALWALISLKTGSELLLPSPSSVIRALSGLAITSDFWITTLFSFLRVFAGIVLSLIIGSVLAVLTESSSILRALLSPLLGVIKATPVASFIILALLWISKGTLPLFITTLIVVPIVWSNVCEGIRSVDKDLIAVTKVYRFSIKDKILKLYVPTIAPFFMAACKSSLGMAWKAGISAEVLSTPDNAIGKELYFSKTYLETPELFAWTFVVIILSVVIEKLLVLALTRFGSRFNFLPRGDRNDNA